MSHRHVGPIGFAHRGDETRASQLHGLARLMAQRAIDKIDARGGTGQQMEIQRLADGSTVRVQVLGNINPPIIRAYITTPDGKTTKIGIVLTIPDYDCGIVVSPLITEQTLLIDDSPVTVDVVRGIVQTDQGRMYAPEDIPAKQRHAIELDSAFATFADMQAMVDGTRFSQHRRIRPGNYTGYMRDLVQLLLGIGQLAKLTYDRRLTEAEVIPAITMSEKDAKQQPDHWGVWRKKEPVGVKAMYDYRFERTHGLTWGQDGTCWVMQIGRSGVFAWPLETDPLSLVPKVRARYRLLYPELFREDLSGLGLFDLWGGFPLGTPPPIGEELEARTNAGDLLELIPRSGMTAFYSKQPFYSSCGWAFAPLQRMAVNTCFGAVAGIKQGNLFNVIWELGVWTEPTPDPLAGQITALLPSGAKPWHLRKASRLNAGQAEQVLGLLTAQVRDDSESWINGFYSTYDAIKVSPPAVGRAELRLMQSGLLYHPSRFAGRGDACLQPTGHPQFKFPEEVMGWQQSFDFMPYDPDAKTPKSCTAPMWACFVADQLMVVSYQWAEEKIESEPPTNSRSDCQYFGTWVTKTESQTRNSGTFFSNFFDLRRTVKFSGGQSVKTTGTYAGNSDYFAFLALFGNCAAITRTVYGNMEIETIAHDSAAWWSSLAVPFGDRSILYSATMAQTNGARTTNSFNGPVGLGGTGFTRWGYVYEWVCHWAGSCPGGKTKQNSDPCVMTELYPMDVGDTCFSQYGPPDFPDYKVCDDPMCRAQASNVCPGYPCVYSAVFGPSPQPGQNSSSTDGPVNKFEWEVKIWGDTHIHGKSILKGVLSGPNAERYDTDMSEWWWISSPTCDPPVFCRFDVGVNRLGRGLINYHDQVDPMNTLHDGQPDNMYSHPGAVFYGYVSDEVIEHG